MKAEDRSSILFPVSGRRAELESKQQRIQQFLSEQGLDALLVSRHENIAWATAGVVELRVALARETGAGSLLFTKDGRRFYLTSENEAPRLRDEEFAGLDFEPITYPWYRNEMKPAIDRLVPTGKVASDTPLFDLPVVSMQPLRLVLTDGEMARYRWLGKCCADAVTVTLSELAPGMTEADMQAAVSQRLLAQSVMPSVLLTAVDQRIRSYRHAVVREGRLERFGMLNLCGRRWGLVISITRFVHFGAMPSELAEKFAAVAEVNARLLDATRKGATADGLFHVAQDAYAECGYPGEEQMHHQGGAISYVEREWVARPEGTDLVQDREAFAWNPTVQGAKIEDTIVLRGDELEILTRTPHLPSVSTSYKGRAYISAGVLQR